MWMWAIGIFNAEENPVIDSEIGEKNDRRNEVVMDNETKKNNSQKKTPEV